MSYNGSGTFVINTAGQPVVSGTVISSTAFNALTADLATGLSTAITKDGQTTPTANIPMGNNKITGLAVGTAATDAANLSQAQSTASKLITVSGTDTVTGTLSPTLTAYAAGQMFYWVAAGTNTGAVTLNIDSLGAKAVTRDGSTALAAGDIRSGEVVVVVYDGTRFQVVSQINSAGDATFANVSITSALNVGGVATFTSNPVLSGGTANGVLYLNGSKAATSGSALTFDGTNLGIGTSSPVAKLDVAKTSNDTISRTNAVGGFGDWASLGAGLLMQQTLSSPYGFALQAANAANSVQFPLLLNPSGGNVGIGTSSPLGKLGIAGSATTTIIIPRSSNGTTASPVETQIIGSTFTNGSYEAGIYALNSFTNTAANWLTFKTSDSGGTSSTKMTLDAPGNLGLGVTPSAANVKTFEVGAVGNTLTGIGGGDVALMSNAYYNSGFKYAGSNLAASYRLQDGVHKWNIAASGTAGNAITFTQAMTLNADGQFLVGATAAVSARGEIRLGGNASGSLFCMGRSGTNKLNIGVDSSDNVDIENTANTPIKIYTNSTERARITAGGYSKFSNDGNYTGSTSSYHEFYQTANNPACYFRATNSTYTTTVIEGSADRATTNTSYYLMDVYNGNFSGRFRVADSGNATNTNGSYGTISDAKMKTDIVNAGSQWADMKAVRFRKFKMKDDPQQIVQLGVVAQELEQTSPGLVEEHTDRDKDGNDLGTTTKSVKTSVLLMKAAVALQEAMARIEQLEAKVAVLESK
jgi:hypothetical protein